MERRAEAEFHGDLDGFLAANRKVEEPKESKPKEEENEVKIVKYLIF
jgi:hypothetical protein